MAYDPARVVADDADYLAGLSDVVAVRVDVNGSGGPTSALGGRAPDYRPEAAYTGLDAEPCRVVFRSARNYRPDDSRPGALARGRVLFGASIDLDLNHQLLYTDPETGRARYLYVDGASRPARDEAGRPHHWVCDFVEYVA